MQIIDQELLEPRDQLAATVSVFNGNDFPCFRVIVVGGLLALFCPGGQGFALPVLKLYDLSFFILQHI